VLAAMWKDNKQKGGKGRKEESEAKLTEVVDRYAIGPRKRARARDFRNIVQIAIHAMSSFTQCRFVKRRPLMAALRLDMFPFKMSPGQHSASLNPPPSIYGTACCGSVRPSNSSILEHKCRSAFIYSHPEGCAPASYLTVA